MYGWVGVGHFESTPLLDLVEGPIGTGAFGSFLVDVFGPATPQFEYHGEEDVNGQSLLTYHFQVPQEASTYRFEASGKSWMTGYEGEFWLDRSESYGACWCASPRPGKTWGCAQPTPTSTKSLGQSNGSAQSPANVRM